VERTEKPVNPGFRDFVKNPELWHAQAEKAEDETAAVAAAKAWSDEQVAAVAWRYVFEPTTDREVRRDHRILRSFGTRTHPVLLGYLRDASLRDRLLKPTTGESPGLPFVQICDLLDRDPPAGAVELVAPFLAEKEVQVRRAAAGVVASAGTDDAVPAIRKALADADEVRWRALSGLEDAARVRRLSDGCRRELFDDFRRLLLAGKDGREATELLLACDRARAVEVFLSAPVFAANSPVLLDVLRALNEKGEPVPRERLLELIAQLGGKDREDRGDQLGAALLALGRHRAADDRPMLDKYAAHADAGIATGAAAGLLASHGLQDFDDRIWNVLDERGKAALTLQQRHYAAVDAFDGEVRNGGLSQYFFNSAGGDWRDALAGLEAIGATEGLAVLREAVAKFGPAGPSEDREARMRQLSKIVKADDAAFGALDTRYYKSSENIAVLTARYVLQHPEAFR
jgi:hypothetical protein